MRLAKRFIHCNSFLYGRTSQETHMSKTCKDVAFSQNDFSDSSVKSVKYRPLRIPSKEPYLNDVYNIPPCFRADSILFRTSINSFFGRCRIEAHAHIPSYEFCASSSLNNIFLTWIPVYADALAHSSSEPSVASTRNPLSRKNLVSLPEPQPRSRISA